MLVSELLEPVPEDEEPDDGPVSVELPPDLSDSGVAALVPVEAAEDSPDVVGVCAGAFNVEEPLSVVVGPLRAPESRVRCCARAALAVVLWPGNAWAATAVKIPVSAALPASSQRLAWPSLRSAASRARVVWGFGCVLVDIGLAGDGGVTVRVWRPV